ncbi:hypothetical protein ONZ43_g3144 [Nemania bipapillata]|uniref:Uncharacterized protein n=1 Tax=Nemania bipapillata TaxID=110536 RepID=A0ACC2IXX1_9PEZI|nr:hypothetical protein ONZ43_g3144 [Nemania bipapillata]
MRDTVITFLLAAIAASAPLPSSGEALGPRDGATEFSPDAGFKVRPRDGATEFSPDAAFKARRDGSTEFGPDVCGFKLKRTCDS